MKLDSPKPPYSNRPTKLIDQKHNRALWRVKCGSKHVWMITDYNGVMVPPHEVGFKRKGDAMSAWVVSDE